MGKALALQAGGPEFESPEPQNAKLGMARHICSPRSSVALWEAETDSPESHGLASLVYKATNTSPCLKKGGRRGLTCKNVL